MIVCFCCFVLVCFHVKALSSSNELVWKRPKCAQVQLITHSLLTWAIFVFFQIAELFITEKNCILSRVGKKAPAHSLRSNTRQQTRTHSVCDSVPSPPLCQESVGMQAEYKAVVHRENDTDCQGRQIPTRFQLPALYCVQRRPRQMSERLGASS